MNQKLLYLRSVRQELPTRRVARTFKLYWNDHKFHVTVGFYDPSCTIIGEVFCSSGKTQQSIQQIVSDACTIISIAIQFGTPIEIIAQSQARFEDGVPYTILGLICDALVNKKWENQE